MSTSATQPNKLSDTQPRKVKPGRAGFWIGLVILLVIVVAGSLIGYAIGISERVNAQKSQQIEQIKTQFELAQQDFEAGRYDIASQRLEYILQKDPSYPGASELLTQVLVKKSITPSPEPTATATITPTPDLRSQEAIFAQAQQQLQSKDWTGVLGSLDALRKADPTYKVVQVDGMYYSAFRNRGVDQILGVGAYQNTNMEGGIYDLTLAERFGPLDNQAQGLRNGARQFLIASSFFEIDWAQAAAYFGDLNNGYPNLRDASDMTVSQYYYQSLLKYGDQQATAKKDDDRCQALDSWGAASNISGLNNDYQYKYNRLFEECYPPTPTVDPASLITPTVEAPTTEAPTAESSPSP